MTELDDKSQDVPPPPDVPLSRWPTEGRSEAANYGIFQIEQVERRSPLTGRLGTYSVLHTPQWANVIALTERREVVLVEQYRHGIDALTLEIPGGMVEAGEAAAEGAERELREETGFTGDPAIHLGTVHPNPAIQSNECSTWLVPNARRTHDLEPDEGEHLAVHLIPLADIPTLLADGRITHSLVVAAFHWLSLRNLDRGAPPSPPGCAARE